MDTRWYLYDIQEPTGLLFGSNINDISDCDSVSDSDSDNDWFDSRYP
jgi:hypothetical protein